MYIPKYYREEDRQKILAFLKQNNFAALVTFDGEKPIATHIPVEVVESESGWTIYGHLSRANTQKKTFGEQEALLIFQGAHTYISARWYTEVDVPTWDYMIVHVYGKVREIQGETEEERRNIVSELEKRGDENSKEIAEAIRKQSNK